MVETCSKKATCLMGKATWGASLKTFLFDSVYGHQDTDWICDCPWSISRGCNTSASVTVHRTIPM